VARHLGLPKELSERQPFPGPGLSVRVVGEIKPDKLESLKKATAIAEEKLEKYTPSQYFAVVLDNIETLRTTEHSEIESSVSHFFKVEPGQVSLKVFQDKATGVREGNRLYGQIAGVRVNDEKGRTLDKPIQDLVKLQETILRDHPDFTRLFYAVHERPSEQPYVISVRAIDTTDFLTAKVSMIPWKTLSEIGQEIIRACRNVSIVYFDVTPKPPATIEME
jgi:GMP synthase (glutamine-hydrolysing)